MESFIFAGQGSQYVGMGKDLYESFPQSKAVFDTADNVLGFSLSRLCFEGPSIELTNTKNCQPAILTMTIAAWEAYKAVSGYVPQAGQYVAGLSLGEYSALVAAEALAFPDAVYLLRKRGEFMEEAARNHPGKMASVLGLELEKVRQVTKETGTEIANINCPGQIVISGSQEAIEKAVAVAEGYGARRAIMLEVSGAFHCSFMQEAAEKLAHELAKTTFKTPRVGVISNVTAHPMAEPGQIRENLIKQVASSVLWEDSMRFMIASGSRSFYEFGPGKVLKGLMKRIDETVTVVNVEKKEDVLACKK